MVRFARSVLISAVAERVGGKTYADIYGYWWPGSMERLELEISAAMTNADRLHFNLDQFDLRRFEQFMQNPAFASGNVTSWELNAILTNSSMLEKTTFYGAGGTIVKAPGL